MDCPDSQPHLVRHSTQRRLVDARSVGRGCCESVLRFQGKPFVTVQARFTQGQSVADYFHSKSISALTQLLPFFHIKVCILVGPTPDVVSVQLAIPQRSCWPIRKSRVA